MKEEPLYQKLADRLDEMIRSRSLRPGDRVPSVRQFSEQQRVSVPTALQAYVTLETRGLIEARPKSGFYVRPRLSDSIPEPKEHVQPSRVTDFANTDPLESILAEHSNPKLVPLGAALPCPDLMPGEKLVRIMAAIGRRLGSASIGYDMAPGSEVLRAEIARRSLEWGCALKASEFIITVGATEAVSLALRATCKPGDTVVVESPTYFGLARTLREMKLKALPLPTDASTGMNLDVLESVLRRKKVAACVVIPTFHNPVGFVMPEANKQRLFDLLSSREIPIIEDDIYGDLQHDGVRPRCLKAFDTDGSVILCSSYSKTLAPGYRVGYVAGGRWHHQLLCLKRTSTLGGSTLAHLAIAEFLKNGGYDRYLRSVRGAYRQQVEQMRELVVEHFPEGISMSRPQGAFLLWCELPKQIDSIELFKRARAAGITIAPGPLFSPDGGFRNYIRINCGYPINSKIERSVSTIGQLLQQMLKG